MIAHYCELNSYYGICAIYLIVHMLYDCTIAFSFNFLCFLPFSEAQESTSLFLPWHNLAFILTEYFKLRLTQPFCVCFGFQTPVSHLCSNGQMEMLELLEDVPSIDYNSPDKDGNAPLHFAAQAGHVEVVSFLLNKVRTISVDPVNHLGFTPLMKAALQGRTKCSKLLLFSGEVYLWNYFFSKAIVCSDLAVLGQRSLD